jgi:hypothetical protein
VIVPVGASLPLPPPFSRTTAREQDREVMLRLINDLWFCWSTAFPAPAGKNDAVCFKDPTP